MSGCLCENKNPLQHCPTAEDHIKAVLRTLKATRGIDAVPRPEYEELKEKYDGLKEK